MTPSPPENSSAPQIDCVLFDYGQVLSLPPNATAWSHIQSITGLDEAQLHNAYWAYRHDYDRAALTGPAYWNAVATHAGITLDDTQRTALLAADVDLWTDLNQPMVQWAGRLQDAGIRTGILSNIGDSIAEGIQARLPWLARFTHCTWSHALHLAKPDPAIYIATAAALHTPPANILFIDDREDNIATARALGMIPLHFTTYPAFEREMQQRGFDSLLLARLSSQTPALYPATK